MSAPQPLPHTADPGRAGTPDRGADPGPAGGTSRGRPDDPSARPDPTQPDAGQPGAGQPGHQALAEGAAIEIVGVSKIFGAGQDVVRALDDVSLAIPRSAFFTLLGPSGCGKTTLLRLIAGFELPSAGHILLNGVEIGHLPPNRRPVNTVFQSYALFPHLTVYENVAFGLRRLRWPRQRLEARVAEMLELVQLTPMAQRRTSQLSGGQQQRVALARAMAPEPQVLLLDEPLSALDLKLRKAMQRELKRLQLETGITFVFVTHDQEEALTMSDQVAVMQGGRVLQVGAPRDIYLAPSSRFVADFIGDINVLDAELLAAEGAGARVQLATGLTRHARLPAGLAARPGPVHVAIRPERLALLPEGQGDWQGVIDDVVFFGNGAHIRVTLDAGVQLLILRPEDGSPDTTFDEGDRVGVAVPEGALQVLSD